MILLALAFAAIFTWWVFRKRVHGPMEPTSNAAALYRWSQRFDAEYPTDSEQRLALQARGTVAKRRLLAHLRNRPQPASAPAGSLFGLQRIGNGELTKVELQVEPLKSLQVEQQVPVTVRRRLSLAR